MGFAIEIGGVMLPADGASQPQSLRSAYRGAEPGSRECGAATFDLFQPREKGTAGLIQHGNVVRIFREGEVIYRGLIGLPLEKEARIWRITTVESSAAMREITAGKDSLWGRDNPSWYAYPWEYEITGPSDPESRVEPFLLLVAGAEHRFLGILRAEDFLPGWGYYWPGMEEWIFDSIIYAPFRPPDGPFVGEILFRSMILGELAIEELADEMLRQGNLQGNLGLQGPAMELGSSEEVCIAVEYETESEACDVRLPAPRTVDDGIAHLTLHGVVTRIVDGRAATYAWYVQGNTLHLWQVINHGLAVHLGKYDFQSWSGPYRPFPDAPNVTSAGPFPVIPNAQYPNFLSFCSIRHGVGIGHFYGRIWEIDLRWPRNLREDGSVVHRFIEGIETDEGEEYDRIVMVRPGVYSFTNVQVPLMPTVALREGGRYEFRPDGHLYWIGELFLAEAALDFRNGTLRDILSELCLVSGCEWWVDKDGQLRILAQERQLTTIGITVDKWLEDTIVEEKSEQEFELDLQGIPLSRHYRTLIEEAWRRRYSQDIQRRRRITILPRGPALLDLGQKLMIGEHEIGKVVAFEAGAFNLKIETEAAIESEVEME
jgi:hypothetical protein